MSDTGKGESRPRICIRAARSLADLYHLLRQKTTVVLTALLAVGVATVLCGTCPGPRQNLWR